MNVKCMSLVLITMVLAGCATREGIRLPTSSGPSNEELESFNKRNAASPPGVPNAQASNEAATTELIPSGGGPRVIIVGNVMSLHIFDESVLNTRYDNYIKKISTSAGKPAFSREWYQQRSSGEVAVKISGIPGIYSRFYTAEVPKDLVGKISFASSLGTFMVGTSGDLVVAEVVPLYGIWITRRLCSENSPDFSTCEAKYQRGLFQSFDGREVDEKYKVKDVGASIDIVTYMKR